MRKTYGRVSFSITATLFLALLVFDWLGVVLVYRVYAHGRFTASIGVPVLAVLILIAVVRSVTHIVRWLVKRYHFIAIDQYKLSLTSALFQPRIELPLSDLRKITFAADKTRPRLIAETAYNRYEILFGGNYLDLARLYTDLGNAGIPADLSGRSARLVTMDQDKLKRKIVIIYAFLFLLIGFLAYRAWHRMHHRHRHHARHATASGPGIGPHTLQIA